jgi:hypothetical protein
MQRAEERALELSAVVLVRPAQYHVDALSPLALRLAVAAVLRQTCAVSYANK